MDKQLQAFLEEAYDLLQELEQGLLDLDHNPENPDTVALILRILHTLKGTSAMFGYSEISDLVHKIEAVYVCFNATRESVDQAVVSATINAVDIIKRGLNQKNSGFEGSEEVLEQIQCLFDKYHSSETAKKSSDSQDHPEKLSTQNRNEEKKTKDISPENSSKKWLIKFLPCIDFFQSGNTPDRLIEELSRLGTLEIDVNCSEIPDFADLDPESLFLSWVIRLKTGADLNEIRDVFIFVEDLAKLEITEVLEDTSSSAGFEELQASTDFNSNDLLEDFASAAQKTVPLNQVELLSSTEVNEQSRKETSVQDSDSGFLKENTEKMIALLGDLVTVQAKLNQKASLQGEPELISIANELESITDELRDCAMHLSMFPIGMMFPSFANAVERAGKGKVKLSLSGPNVEIDRSAHSLIKYSLVNLVEVLAEFVKETSKPLISLRARHQVGKAQIELWVDTEAEVARKIFDFSEIDLKNEFILLSEELERVSGNISFARNIESRVEITITLPLNLAIIESLIVKIGGAFFLLPLADIEECIELSEEDQRKSYRKNVAVVRGQFVPYIHLREKFSIEGKAPAVQQIVILKLDNQRIGVVVDQVVGEYQTAIKTWGKFCSDVAGISGAAILGDGGIALLIDFKALIDEEKEILERNLKEQTHGV